MHKIFADHTSAVIEHVSNMFILWYMYVVHYLPCSETFIVESVDFVRRDFLDINITKCLSDRLNSMLHVHDLLQQIIYQNQE